MHSLVNPAKLLAAAVAVFAVAGCATHERGIYEKLTVTSTPAQALCKIYREKLGGYQKSIVTPGAKYIRRDNSPVTLVCSKKGYQTATVVLEASVPEGTGIGNVATFGFGYIVDGVSGALYDIDDEVHIDLEKE